MPNERFVILLAEDDQGHADLVEINLKRAGIANRIVHVADGQEAIDYFQCQGTYASRERGGPLLAILDINMPRLDGVEVLARLKADPQTSNLPVIMLTTTDDPREVERCYELGCSVYITKPVGYDSFVDAIRRLGLFLQVVRIPSEHH